MTPKPCVAVQYWIFMHTLAIKAQPIFDRLAEKWEQLKLEFPLALTQPVVNFPLPCSMCRTEIRSEVDGERHYSGECAAILDALIERPS